MASRFGGLVIWSKVFGNPRCEGSHGHRSMYIVLDAGADGITFEDYIAKVDDTSTSIGIGARAMWS